MTPGLPLPSINNLIRIIHKLNLKDIGLQFLVLRTN